MFFCQWSFLRARSDTIIPIRRAYKWETTPSKARFPIDAFFLYELGSRLFGLDVDMDVEIERKKKKKQADNKKIYLRLKQAQYLIACSFCIHT